MQSFKKSLGTAAPIAPKLTGSLSLLESLKLIEKLVDEMDASVCPLLQPLCCRQKSLAVMRLGPFHVKV